MSSMVTTETYGPVDVLVLEFPGEIPGTGTAAAIQQLVTQGTIRLYDLLIVHKDENGSCTQVDITSDSGTALAGWRPLLGARSGLLRTADLNEAAHVLDPNTTAALLLYENAWAVPFVAAARSEGAELVASARITAQEMMDELDALEASGN